MTYFFLLPLSFLISLVFIFFLKKLAFKHHLYDDPSGDTLKIHQKPIPYLGGVGMFLGLVFGLVLARLFHQISGLQSLGFIIGGIIIIFLGLWDDLKWKKFGQPVLKLFCQFIAGFLIVLVLIKIGVNFSFSATPLIASLIAGFYVVGAMNALNMEDGMDGLAGGSTLISLLGFATLALLNHNSLILVLTFSLVGPLVAFLVYNWHPASIFMGDNGSHFLGFILAVLAIIFTNHNLKQFIGPILILGLPILDTAAAIIRRLIKGKSPFRGDRSHFYDWLHRHGFSVRQTVLLCYLIQSIIVGIGVIIYRL